VCVCVCGGGDVIQGMAVVCHVFGYTYVIYICVFEYMCGIRYISRVAGKRVTNALQ